MAEKERNEMRSLVYIVMIMVAIVILALGIQSRGDIALGGESFVFVGLMAYAIGHLIEGKKEDE